jgi:triacylglycerol lipase
VSPGWRVPHAIVNRAEGPNDGVVSVASATWGEHTDVWEGDHLNLVNWPNRLARKQGFADAFAPDYGRIVRRIADCVR